MSFLEPPLLGPSAWGSTGAGPRVVVLLGPGLDASPSLGTFVHIRPAHSACRSVGLAPSPCLGKPVLLPLNDLMH